nr:uncharacterized protein LOC113816240 [Penaeus vannamei]
MDKAPELIKLVLEYYKPSKEYEKLAQEICTLRGVQERTSETINTLTKSQDKLSQRFQLLAELTTAQDDLPSGYGRRLQDHVHGLWCLEGLHQDLDVRVEKARRRFLHLSLRSSNSFLLSFSLCWFLGIRYIQSNKYNSRNKQAHVYYNTCVLIATFFSSREMFIDQISIMRTDLKTRQCSFINIYSNFIWFASSGGRCRQGHMASEVVVVLITGVLENFREN